MMDDPLVTAHKQSIRHRSTIAESVRCACFYCFAEFAPADIRRWIDDGETALCPRCGIDSVLGSASGLSLDELFLRRMQERWF